MRVVAFSKVRHVVENGEELVILFLADGIVLVIVTLGTFQSEPQPGAAGGLETVDNGLDSELFFSWVVPLGLHRVAVKASRDLFSKSAIRQKVPGNLLDGELVKRLVGVDGVDDPVAIDPHVTGAVRSVARGVSVTGEVEPVLSETLSEMR